jgi:hypothetical protein
VGPRIEADGNAKAVAIKLLRMLNGEATEEGRRSRKAA